MYQEQEQQSKTFKLTMLINSNDSKFYMCSDHVVDTVRLLEKVADAPITKVTVQNDVDIQDYLIMGISCAN